MKHIHVTYSMKPGFLFLIWAVLTFESPLVAQSVPELPRTLITTDGEIDDVDSFIRMLLYSNEFQIEGLVYSSSMWHYKGDGKGTQFISEMEMTQKMYGEKTNLRWPGTQWMQELLNAYGKVQPNLSLHAEGFPTAAHLKSLIKVGNIDFEGEMEKDTEGSDFIKEKLLDDDTSPLYIQVWGGTNTVARALKSIEEAFAKTAQWQEVYNKVVEKTVLYTILDQDATYRKYISVKWPDIKVYYNSSQFWSLAYGWQKVVPDPWHRYLEGPFMGDNIINGHGPLTKMYYSYGDGQKQPGDDEHIHGDPTKLKNAQWGTFQQYDFISEGDSPAFLQLINVGLENLQHPEYGGWGGRLAQSLTNPRRWEDGDEVADYDPFTGKMDMAYPQTRWLPALQLDFASRAQWCINDFKHANHPPMVKLDHQANLQVKSGSTLELRGSASDPDGDALTYHWWQYEEVGTYKGKIILENQDDRATRVTLPQDFKKGDTAHVILEVTDSRFPNLTRYRRVVLTGE